MKIGNAIKLIRVNKGISQVELSEMVGISSSYLSLIEKNKREPNIDLLNKISKKMNVPLSILIFLATDSKEILELDKSLYMELSKITMELIKMNEKE